MRRSAIYGFSVAMIVSFHTAPLAHGEAVKLSGREAEAVNVATRDFIAKHYSRSGDLRHYIVEMERRGGTVERQAVPLLGCCIDPIEGSPLEIPASAKRPARPGCLGC